MNSKLKSLIAELESSSAPRIRSEYTVEAIKLKPDPSLLSNLSGSYGALFLRTVLQKLNIDEHHVFRWRVENKYEQYKILNHYIPGCMPKTFGLSRLLNRSVSVQNIKRLFSKGFFLKATLGDASFFTKSWDKTAEFDSICKQPNAINNTYEDFMVQKKLHLKCEYRIHSFGREIIPALTYKVQDKEGTDRRIEVENFLGVVLKKLPDAILVGTLIAWDIAVTNSERYFVIEANFTGFHPQYRRGFQTTGYVDDPRFGPVICAWLNIYFYQKYGLYLAAIEHSLFTNYPFYSTMIYYMSVLRTEHLVFVKNKKHTCPFFLIIYLGDDSNTFVYDLVKHFLLVDFAQSYQIIIEDEFLPWANERLGMDNKVELCTESSLFTIEQFHVIQQLTSERRKQICCYHLLRQLDGSYVILQT